MLQASWEHVEKICHETMHHNLGGLMIMNPELKNQSIIQDVLYTHNVWC